MKKEIKAEFLWHLDEVMLAFQVAIVTTVDVQGRVNAAPFGLVMPFNSSASNPQMLLCSNNRWHTSQNIEATLEFAINYAPYSLIKEVAATGLLYSEGINELEKAGLSAIPSLKIKPPRIQECYQHIECHLSRVIRPSEYQNNFIGDVLSISINEELSGKAREERLKASDPLMLFGMDITNFQGNYAGLGKTIAYAPPETDVE